MFGFSPPGKGFAMRKGEADVGSGQQTGDQHVQRLRWGGLGSGVEAGGPEGSGCRWKVEPKEGRGRGERSLVKLWGQALRALWSGVGSSDLVPRAVWSHTKSVF